MAFLCPRENPNCQNSAIELIGACLVRIFTGDWTRWQNDVIIVSILLTTLVLSWFVAFYMLKISTLWEKTRPGARRHRASAVPASSRSASLVVSDNAPSGQGQAVGPVDGNREEGGENAARTEQNSSDYRAAGDGWEADEDVDYVVDEDLLIQGAAGFSDEDSDDDTVVLRRIIMAADDVRTSAERAVVDEPPIEPVTAARVEEGVEISLEDVLNGSLVVFSQPAQPERQENADSEQSREHGEESNKVATNGESQPQ